MMSRGKGIDMKAYFAVGIMIGLTACATTIETHVDHDERQAFGAYHTYAWIRDDPLIQAQRSDYVVSPLNRRRVIEAVESELAAKGFSKTTDRGSADFVVAYTIGARDMLEAYSYPEPYNGGWGWGRRYFGAGVDVHTYVQGTLAIDIFDRKSHQPVWHGWAQKRVTESDRKDAAGRIRTAVNKILQSFPPT
jgi:hypothetical protein